MFYTRANFGPCQTSITKRFTKLVKGIKLLHVNNLSKNVYHICLAESEIRL